MDAEMGGKVGGKTDSGRHNRIGQNIHPGLGAQRQTASSRATAVSQFVDRFAFCIQPSPAARARPTTVIARVEAVCCIRTSQLHRLYSYNKYMAGAA